MRRVLVLGKKVEVEISGVKEEDLLLEAGFGGDNETLSDFSSKFEKR